MFSQLEQMIAFRYIFSKRDEGFISISAWFSLIGIILGVSTLIIVMSVMNGFRTELIDRVLGLNGHLGVYENSGNFNNYNSYLSAISEIPGVKAVVPQVSGQGLLVSSQKSSGVIINGLRWTDLPAKTQLWNSLSDKKTDFYRNNAILIGKKLASRFNFKIGDEITLLTSEMQVTAFGSLPKQKKFIIQDIFDVGMYEYDNNFCFISLKNSQYLMGHKTNESITNLEIYLNGYKSVTYLKKRIKSISEKNLSITDWKERNSSFINALNVERNVMFIILTLIVMVASFNIISSLIMLVRTKHIDIAILSSLGMNRFSIMKIFLIIGSFIGILSTMIGTIIGLLFCYNIDNIKIFIEKFLQVELFSAEIYLLTKLPAIVDPFEVIKIVCLSLSLSFLASIYPAWKASGIDPVEILRYE